ncbi:MAG: arylsulfatase [Planctomycetota bacterium]
MKTYLDQVKLTGRFHLFAIVFGMAFAFSLLAGADVVFAGWESPQVATGARDSDQAKPNIVLIYTDDQGYGDVSALNRDAKFETPNIDRLAREGMTFTDGHSADTVCTPSRYALLTGRYCWRTRLKRGVLGAEAECLIADGEVTLASFLRDQGYQTAMIGKWHLGMEFVGSKGQDRDWSKPFRDGPIEKGFDRFFGIPASMNYGVLAWLDQDRVTQAPTKWTQKKRGMVKHDSASYRIAPPYLDVPDEIKNDAKRLEVAPDFIDQEVLKVLTEKSIQWLRKAHQDQRPFFLYLPLTSPHKPVVPLKEFQGKSDCGAYGDFMVETDYRVGQILDTLDELQIADSTIVILTSDNGPENTWRGRIEKFQHRSAGIYRDGKRSRYEGGHRVPFFVRWPAKVKANSKCHVPVCQTDFLATFADVLQQPLPSGAGMDSVSLFPGLVGKTFEREPVVHHSSNGQFAIRSGDWKLIINETRGQRQSGVKHELYRLSDDPSETANLAKTNEAKVVELKQKLAAIRAR